MKKRNSRIANKKKEKVSPSSKKSKPLRKKLPFYFLFAIGLLIFLYPQISRMYYRVSSTQEIAVFDEEKNAMTEEEISERLRLAKAFNDSLVNNVSEDPYEEKNRQEGRAEYARMLEINEQIGHIQIPSIDVDIPIYAGTGENVLQKGAGHLEGTSLPVGGNSTHTVITAHSGLPTAKLFTDLKEVKEGDRFYIHNVGEILAYQVDQIKVIEPHEFENLLIEPGHDYATLLTCTPYMINTHRLLVRGHRVPYVAAVDKRLMAQSKQTFLYQYLFYGLLVVIVLLIAVAIYYHLLAKKFMNKKKELLVKQESRKIKFKRNEDK